MLSGHICLETTSKLVLRDNLLGFCPLLSAIEQYFRIQKSNSELMTITWAIPPSPNYNAGDDDWASRDFINQNPALYMGGGGILF